MYLVVEYRRVDIDAARVASVSFGSRPSSGIIPFSRSADGSLDLWSDQMKFLLNSHYHTTSTHDFSA